MTTVGDQYACVQANEACIAQGTGSFSLPLPGGGQANYYNGPVNTNGSSSAAQPPRPSPPPTSYAPRLSFNTSRGGSTVYAGDTWTITITGAPPNQPVSVLGVHPDGGSATQGYGNTDGSGNFKLAGTITPDMTGNWQETWTVGGQQAGSFSFTVATPQAQQQQAPTPPQAPAPVAQTMQQLAQSAATLPASASSFSFSSIPWWGWGIAAVGGFMLLGGRK